MEVAGYLPVLWVYSWLGFSTLPRSVRVRQSVRDRLVAAAATLPSDVTLVVLDGWRSPEFQRELLAYYSRGGDVTGFVADPDDPSAPAPHTTGGAVDLTLRWRGACLGLGTDYDAFTDDAAVDALERTGAASRVARDLRRLLAGALSGQGFVPHPGEWWHWSYGDVRWAAVTGAEATRYATVRADHPAG